MMKHVFSTFNQIIFRSNTEECYSVFSVKVPQISTESGTGPQSTIFSSGCAYVINFKEFWEKCELTLFWFRGCSWNSFCLTVDHALPTSLPEVVFLFLILFSEILTNEPLWSLAMFGKYSFYFKLGILFYGSRQFYPIGDHSIMR